MQKVRLYFNELLGRFYNLEIRMLVLNWFLDTGNPWLYGRGCCKDGVSKHLFAYSSNERLFEFNLLFMSIDHINLFFDAVMARAVYKKGNPVIEQWRSAHKIFSDKYRVLSFPYEGSDILSYLRQLEAFKGSNLRKDRIQPEFVNRTCPKILDIKTFTYGQGWVVQFMYSFKEFDYESGWSVGFIQEESESLGAFYERVLKEMSQYIADSVE